MRTHKTKQTQRENFENDISEWVNRLVPSLDFSLNSDGTITNELNDCLNQTRQSFSKHASLFDVIFYKEICNHLRSSPDFKIEKLADLLLPLAQRSIDSMKQYRGDNLEVKMDLAYCLTKDLDCNNNFGRDDNRAIELYRDVLFSKPAQRNIQEDAFEEVYRYYEAYGSSRYPAASYILGECYNKGIFEDQNLARGLFYFSLAAINSDKTYSNENNRVKSNSREEINKASRGDHSPNAPKLLEEFAMAIKYNFEIDAMKDQKKANELFFNILMNNKNSESAQEREMSKLALHGLQKSKNYSAQAFLDYYYEDHKKENPIGNESEVMKFSENPLSQSRLNIWTKKERIYPNETVSSHEAVVLKSNNQSRMVG